MAGDAGIVNRPPLRQRITSPLAELPQRDKALNLA